MATKRKLAAMGARDEEPVDPSDELMFLCLGGGNEVGRSSHIIQYKGKTVMLDAGMHPAYNGLSALPFYDEFDLSTVDVLLISHFHVDHAASLPYVLAKTNFKGRVFMTHPTKAIYKWLISDTVRVSHMHSSSEQPTQLYTEADHLSTFTQIEAIDYHTTHTISSIRITPYPAGHVLGAAMFLIEIEGLKILFTGDYSREEDRHLIAASVPANVKVDVLICESTFGIGAHMPRAEREVALTRAITTVLNRGGRVLMPSFALGTAQELLLILDEHWARHPELQKIPIYFASTLARKCMVVYQTYVGSMNDNIKRLFQERMADAKAAGDSAAKKGPWDFQFVRSLRSLDRFDDVGGCVMLASPGMIQSGASRELLERWAPDPRNGVIMTGYAVEGTMGKMIMNEPETIQAVVTRSGGAGGRGRGPGSREGEPVMIPRRCTVQEFSFAAHVDGQQNRDFIEDVAAPVVILVHGEKHNMMRLKSKLLSLNADKKIPAKIYSPVNCEELRIPFKVDKIAKVVGKLAQVPPPSLAIRNKSDQQTATTSDGNDDVEEIDRGKALTEAKNGAVANAGSDQTTLIAGVLVQDDFRMSLMAPEDLREYAGLTTTTITCRQRLKRGAAGAELIRWALEGTFGSVKETNTGSRAKALNGTSANGIAKTVKEERNESNGIDEDVEMDDGSEEATVFEVMDCVKVKRSLSDAGAVVEVEWESNMVNDSIADAVIAALMAVESSPAAVKQSSKHHSHHDHDHGDPPQKRRPNPHAAADPSTRFDRLCLFLESQFGPSITPLTHPPLQVDSSTDNDPPPPSTTKPTSISIAAGPIDPSTTNDGKDAFTPAERDELARLHALGIPVPGVEIKIGDHVARVWLERLEVECRSAPLRDRIKAVVGRAVETVAPIWAG